MSVSAIDWRALRALRDAGAELISPKQVNEAFAATREAEERARMHEARPGYDIFVDGQVSIPEPDGEWVARLRVAVLGLAACMNVAGDLPDERSEAWSKTWVREPAKLRLLGLARSYVERASFFLGKYDQVGPLAVVKSLQPRKDATVVTPNESE